MFERGLPGKLVLIRHGESERNKAKRGEVFFKTVRDRDKVAGTPDHRTPLTKTGQRQAAGAGIELKKRFGLPSEIIHSGYLRTQETTECILTAYGENERAMIDVRRDHRVRERSPGWAYDMTTAEVREHFPWLKTYWKTAGAFFSRPPGGESLAEVADRLVSFVRDLEQGVPGRTTFIVTHGNTVRCLRFLIEELGYEDIEKMRWPMNCGMVAYDLSGERPRLLATNEPLAKEN